MLKYPTKHKYKKMTSVSNISKMLYKYSKFVKYQEKNTTKYNLSKIINKTSQKVKDFKILEIQRRQKFAKKVNCKQLF